MPQKGDTFKYSQGFLDTAAIFNFLDTGTNLSWDFDSLIPLRQGVYRYKSVNATPYNSVPNSRIAELIADTFFLNDFEVYDLYNFYKSDSKVFAQDYLGVSIPTGIALVPTIKIQQAYTDADEVYQFPLDYGDRDSSTYNFTYDVNNFLFKAHFSRRGYRINEVNAWGSMKTPFGTFNCIRVVTDIVGLDSINFDTVNFGLNTHQREYKWLSDSLEVPILKIAGLVVNELFIPASVEFLDSNRNLPSVLSPIALFSADNFTPSIWDTVEFSNFSVSFRKPTYTWKISPTSYRLVNGTSLNSQNLSVVFKDTVNYDVELIVSSSGGKDTLSFEDYIRVDKLTTLSENSLSRGIVLPYPNPVSTGNNVRFKGLSQDSVEHIEVFNLNGQRVDMDYVKKGSSNLNFLAPEKSGVYFVKFQFKNGHQQVFQLMVH